MRGLLIKEIISMKGLSSAFIVGVCLLVVYNIIGVNITAFVIFFVGLLASVNLFDFDDKSRWDQYAITLPVRRRDIVKARYFMILSLVLLAFGLGSVISMLFQSGTDIEAQMIGNVIVTAIVLVYLSIYMPLLYKFGVTKGRYLSLFALAMFVVAVYLLGLDEAVLEKMFMNVAITFGDFINFVPYLILPAGLLIYWVSHLWACHIYEHLDF